MTAVAPSSARQRPRRLDDQLARLRDEITLRAKSFIITLYGDAVQPHGGSAWLGSVIRLVAPFGLSERVVRTAVFRLSRDGWLTATQIGRRSYYSLTDVGHRRCEVAFRRIYGPARRDWDGEWCLVSLAVANLETAERDALRRELTWQGFGALGPDMLICPIPDPDAVRQVLRDAGVLERVVVMHARADAVTGTGTLYDLVRRCWDLDRLAEGYEDFLDRFRPVYQALEAQADPDPMACLMVRLLLMHDYRRVLLRDPMLPDELLPPDWPGIASRALCRNLYRLVLPASQKYLTDVLQTAEGPPPDPAPSFYRRFLNSPAAT